MTNQQLSMKNSQKDITSYVNGQLAVMQEEGLIIPKNYSATNALKSAFFAITNHASGNLLEKCDSKSVANALLDMVIQGLSPAKTQCYFVAYGQNLKLTRSYFGSQAVLKRLSNVKDIWATVIYEGDKFEIDIKEGREVLKVHETSFLNRDNPIIGAYAIVVTNDGEKVLTVMTKKEIDISWSMSKTKNVQSKFPQEMAKRTVINRAAKAFINTSDDSDAFLEAFNRTTKSEYDDDNVIDIQDVQQEIKENANQTLIDIPTTEAVEMPEAKEQEPVEVIPQTEEESQQMALEGDEDWLNA